MYTDIQNELSSEQAVTATAASTNYIDTHNNVDRVGKPLPLFATVEEAFEAVGAATMTIVIQESVDSAFSSPLTVVSTGAIGKADLGIGAKIELPTMPRKTLRYVRANYVVATGPMTAGTITLGLVDEKQNNDADVNVELAALVP